MKKINEKDMVTLIDESYKKSIIKINNNTDKFKGIGVFNPSTLIGKEYGKKN